MSFGLECASLYCVSLWSNMSKVALAPEEKRPDSVSWVGPMDGDSDDEKEGCCSLVGSHAREYADGTSLHGIKYTCEPGRPWVERYY